MYRLHIANKNYSSWSLRPWVLMRALGIPFEERLTPFGSGSNWEKFRSFSPNGQVPCLHDGATVVWESLAIVEHLAERHPGVWPRDAAARSWARCASAEMHGGFSALRNRCTTNIGLRVRLDDVPAALERDVARIAELWEEGLARFGGPWLAGAAFGAADAFFAPVAFRVQTYGLALPTQAAEYARRILALPAMRQWESEALAEAWREPGHESDAVASGVVLEDRRAKAG